MSTPAIERIHHLREAFPKRRWFFMHRGDGTRGYEGWLNDATAYVEVVLGQPDETTVALSAWQRSEPRASFPLHLWNGEPKRGGKPSWATP